MQIIIQPASVPTVQELNDTVTGLQALVNGVKDFSVSLSIEQRSSSYKMGAKRYAYAKTAERIAKQYINVMPRQFDDTHFTQNINLIDALQAIQLLIDQLGEQIDDTLMAARIDAMTYTKQVHDSLRLANTTDPSFDTPLRDLDDFNTRATAEEIAAPETAKTITPTA